MAYAAVISVKQTIKSLLKGSEFNKEKELKSIQADLCSVQSILESVSYLDGGERDDAHRKQIKALASKLEDLITSQSSHRSESSSLTRSQELVQVKQQLIDRAHTLKMEKRRQQSSQDGDGDEDEDEEQPSQDGDGDEEQSSQDGDGDEEQPSDSFVPMRRNNEMVGLVSELIQIQSWLLHDLAQLDVIPIVGRSGIGKTTLARNIYDNEHVSSRFSQKFFVTVGQRYELKEFLLFLIDQMNITIPDIQHKNDKQIGVYLHQFLVGRKYLIVLDDVRNSQAWKMLKNLFPDDRKSGSRIILTTTRQDLACSAATNSNFLSVPLLNDDQSWTLLKQMIFSSEANCPFNLEKFGRKIAKNCDGLPRAIRFTANSLRRNTSVEHWSRASEDTFLQSNSRDDTTFLEAYRQLPPHLQECFLYMGVFPPSHDIPTSKLLKLWAAEGLVLPEEGNSKSLEETARAYLDDLISRNLVSVCQQSSRGRTKSCRIHFLDRNVCIGEAKREKFFHVISKYNNNSLEGDLESQSRLCILNNIVLALKDVHDAIEEHSPEARSLLCVGPQHQHWLPLCLNSKVLKVLDALTLRFHEFPPEVLELRELKYLAITCDGNVPPSVSKLENLQVLIVHRYQRVKFSDTPVYLPREIWKLRKLKHLECMGYELVDPRDDSLILEELLTLAGVSVHSCTLGVFAGIPKLLKLRIWTESTGDAAKAFSFFHKYNTVCPALDSFKCNVMIRGPLSQAAASPIPAFPGAENLKKITLSRCRFKWEHMKNIGGLPNLEVLKLRCYAFCGEEWETKLGEFVKLKFLLLEDLDIERWTLNDDYEACESYCEQHFPELEHLIMRHCYRLVEIPDKILDFDALKTIELDQCSRSATICARKLEEERVESGNNEPQFRIHCAFL